MIKPISLYGFEIWVYLETMACKKKYT